MNEYIAIATDKVSSKTKKEGSYPWWEGPYTEGPLLIVNPTTPHEVKQHSNSPHDFIPVNPLGHLMGPISISPEFISGMCSLLARLALPKSEVHRYYGPIHPLLVDQCQQVHHLLHPNGTGSL